HPNAEGDFILVPLKEVLSSERRVCMMNPDLFSKEKDLENRAICLEKLNLQYSKPVYTLVIDFCYCDTRPSAVRDTLNWLEKSHEPHILSLRNILIGFGKNRVIKLSSSMPI